MDLIVSTKVKIKINPMKTIWSWLTGDEILVLIFAGLLIGYIITLALIRIGWITK